MVSTRAPRVPADEARRRIVEAATTLLRDRRYRDLTVEDVMAEAQLSRTVFYRYFDGLPGVALALLEGLLAGVVAEEAEHGPGAETLRRQLEMVVRTFHDYGPILLALAAAAHADPKVEAAYLALLDQSVVATEAMVTEDVRHLARALTNMNSQYLLDLVAHGPEFDQQQAVDVLFTIWQRTTLPTG